MPPNLDIGKYVFNIMERILDAIHPDTFSGGSVVMDFILHELLSGNYYIYTDSNTLNDGGTVVYLIETDTNTRKTMIKFFLEGSAITQFDFYKDSTRTGSVAQSVGNANMESSNGAGLTIHKGIVAGGADGILCHTYKGGAASQQSRAPSGAGNDGWLILNRGTKYLLRFTSSTNSNLTNARFEIIDKAD